MRRLILRAPKVALVTSLLAHVGAAGALARSPAQAAEPAPRVARAQVDVEFDAPGPRSASPRVASPIAPPVASPARANDELRAELKGARHSRPSFEPPQAPHATPGASPSSTAPAQEDMRASSSFGATNDDAPRRFALTVGAPTAPAAASARGGDAATKTTEAVRETEVSQRARLLAGATPRYPKAARDAQIEVDVPVELLVGTDGHVIDARATSHVGYGLEDAALAAARAFRFAPAERAGRAVAVRMRWLVSFRLQD